MFTVPQFRDAQRAAILQTARLQSALALISAPSCAALWLGAAARPPVQPWAVSTAVSLPRTAGVSFRLRWPGSSWPRFMRRGAKKVELVTNTSLLTAG